MHPLVLLEKISKIFTGFSPFLSILKFNSFISSYSPSKDISLALRIILYSPSNLASQLKLLDLIYPVSSATGPSTIYLYKISFPPITDDLNVILVPAT